MGEGKGGLQKPGPGDRLRRLPDIAWREVGEETILVNVKQDEVMQLDSVGSFIWSRLSGDETLRNIAESLVGEFAVEMEAALEDTIEFAASLVDRGVAKIIEAGRS